MFNKFIHSFYDLIANGGGSRFHRNICMYRRGNLESWSVIPVYCS